MYFSVMFFLFPSTKYSRGSHTYLTRIQFSRIRPPEIRGSGGAIYLPYLVSTTSHCLVSTGGEVNFLETRNLVSGKCRLTILGISLHQKQFSENIERRIVDKALTNTSPSNTFSIFT